MLCSRMIGASVERQEQSEAVAETNKASGAVVVFSFRIIEVAAVPYASGGKRTSKERTSWNK